MKVRELIKKLEEYPNDMKVIIGAHHKNYLLSSIFQNIITNEYKEEKENCLMLMSSWVEVEQIRGKNNEENIKIGE